MIDYLRIRFVYRCTSKSAWVRDGVPQGAVRICRESDVLEPTAGTPYRYIGRNGVTVSAGDVREYLRYSDVPEPERSEILATLAVMGVYEAARGPS